MLIEITADLFDISSRIKEIDPRYKIFYDTGKNAFKLYMGDRYELTFPFPHLDVRALDYAFETRTERLDEILAKIDRHNENVHTEAVKRAQDNLEDMAVTTL
ncbi:MAG TPA: hypothetical protein PKY53_04760 [Clostridia bacterium]|nr:hypothetical protein [Clostridia bacterium]